MQAPPNGKGGRGRKVCTIVSRSDHGNRQTSVSKWLVKAKRLFGDEKHSIVHACAPRWCFFCRGGGGFGAPASYGGTLDLPWWQVVAWVPGYCNLHPIRDRALLPTPDQMHDTGTPRWSGWWAAIGEAPSNSSTLSGLRRGLCLPQRR